MPAVIAIHPQTQIPNPPTKKPARAAAKTGQGSTTSKAFDFGPHGIAEQIEAEKKPLRVEKLADYLGVTEKTVYRLTKAGRIPSFKVGNAVRFDPKQTAQWLRGQSMGFAAVA